MKKKQNPKAVFELCIKAASKFPMNYVDEFDEEEPTEYGFNGQYENCRKFTALLICCSIVYIKTLYKDNHEPNPFEDEFYKPFISLVLEEAKKISSLRMLEDLEGGHDGEQLWVEELPEYRIMEYFKEAAGEIVRISQSNGQYMPNILAFNYYNNPGTLIFHSKRSLDDEPKVNELKEIIHKVFQQIMPSII